MYIEKLTLYHFRNYESLHIRLEPSVQLLIGDNAQGKTNLLEAIYLLSTGHSHRTHHDADLIRWGEEGYHIEGSYIAGHEPTDLAVSYSPLERRKKVKIDGISKQGVSSLIGQLTTVLFAPEDLKLIKGSPAERRKLLDRLLSQSFPAYYHDLIKYNRIVIQRNALLKSIREKDVSVSTLDIWDEQLISLGLGLIKRRISAIEKLQKVSAKIHHETTNGEEHLSMYYLCSLADNLNIGNGEALYHSKLKHHRSEEIARATTVIGPHRDDLIFEINNKDARAYGSQGQQRTVVLSLKMAELELLKEETGEYPVLLLDDVLSELDHHRRHFLLAQIRDRVQTLVTATSADSCDLPDCRVFQVCHGEIV